MGENYSPPPLATLLVEFKKLFDQVLRDKAAKVKLCGKITFSLLLWWLHVTKSAFTLNAKKAKRGEATKILASSITHERSQPVANSASGCFT